MSPEQALVTVVVLLWGPTAIWFLYRATRGRDTSVWREPGSSRVPSELIVTGQSASTPGAVQSLVERHGFWVCNVCRSLNRPEAGRCYGCRTSRDQALGEPPASTPEADRPLVPVMADPAELAEGIVAVTAGPTAAMPAGQALASVSEVAITTVAQAGQSASPGQAAPPTAVTLAPDRAPISASYERAQSPGSSTAGPGREDAGPRTGSPAARDGAQGMAARFSDAATGAPSTATPAPVVAPGAPGPNGRSVTLDDAQPTAMAAVAAQPPDGASKRAGLPVCPFLGLEADPSSWFDFPDPANLCHAVPGRDPSPIAAIRRFLTGAGHPQAVSAEQQRMACLAEAHRSCPRYVMVMAPVATPDGNGRSMVMAHKVAAPRPLPDHAPAATNATQPQQPVVEPRYTWRRPLTTPASDASGEGKGLAAPVPPTRRSGTRTTGARSARPAAAPAEPGPSAAEGAEPATRTVKRARSTGRASESPASTTRSKGTSEREVSRAPKRARTSTAGPAPTRQANRSATDAAPRSESVDAAPRQATGTAPKRPAGRVGSKPATPRAGQQDVDGGSPKPKGKPTKPRQPTRKVAAESEPEAPVTPRPSGARRARGADPAREPAESPKGQPRGSRSRRSAA